ncbi:MAG: SMP-30/gluconolactonase/LRE family protein [Thermoplasmata archaeon]
MNKEEFHGVVGPDPRLIRVTATDAHEGLVYVGAEDALYYTTLPAPTPTPQSDPPPVAIKRVALADEQFPLSPKHISVVREPANMANGMTLDRQGRLVICEQGTWSEPARVARMDLVTGKLETLVSAWEGRDLNSPNDVVVQSDGTVWFTDPTYGYLQGFRPKPQVGDHVYRLDPATRQLSVVADSLNKPNGLAFSPDESTLYIGDSGANQEPGSFYADLPHHVRAFDVTEDGHLRNDRLFCVTNPGFPDGIKVDGRGRVYVSAFSGVQVFNVLGEMIGEIRLPGAVNFAFGGPTGNLLFIATDDAIWAAAFSDTVSGRREGGPPSGPGRGKVRDQ